MPTNKPLTYRPFAGVEFAFSPELIDTMYDAPDDTEFGSESVDLTGLRPVYESVTTSSYRLGQHTFTTTHRVITNRPTTTNKEQNQS